jgi:isocitrate dehydrogenase
MKHTVYWIEGDGIGPEIWSVARPVIDAAMRMAAPGHEIEWIELLAGEKAVKKTGSPLPAETIDALGSASIAIKGPLGTPVGGGMRSLNVALRQRFDLYACIRPVTWYQGISAPVKHPEHVNMVIFRENTEDVYAGIEYEAGSAEAEKLAGFLRTEFGADIREHSAIGIKPISEFCSKRLVRKAIRYAVEHELPSVTLVHKGNIMKFTEGGFRKWGYEVAHDEFGQLTIPEKEATPENSKGKIIIKDRIADAMFQEALLHPEQYSVLALPNLNGDYISDALAAQVGGLGMAPGVNLSDTLAIFEATHGTAPTAAGKDIANPGSLLLSGALMLEHMGLPKASEMIRQAILSTIADKIVTPDLAANIPGARAVSCSAYGKALLANMGRL